MKKFLLILAFISAYFPTHSYEDWKMQYTVENDRIRSLHFQDSLNGCSITEKGLLLYTENGGNNWRVIEFDSSYSFTDSKLYNNKVFSLANDVNPDRSYLYEFNLSNDVLNIDTLVGDRLSELEIQDSNNIFLVDSRSVFKKVGVNKFDLYLYGFGDTPYSMSMAIDFRAFNSENQRGVDNYINYHDYSVMSSFQYLDTNDMKWKAYRHGDIYIKESFFLNPNVGWWLAKGYEGPTGSVEYNGIIFSNNSGRSISILKKFDDSNKLIRIFFTDLDVGYGISSGNELMKTTDGGKKWYSFNNPLKFNNIFFVNRNIGWAITKDYLSIYKTENGGGITDIKNIQSSIFSNEFDLNVKVKDKKMFIEYDQGISPNSIASVSLINLKGQKVELSLFNKNQGIYCYDISKLSKHLYILQIKLNNNFLINKKILLLK